MSFIVVGVFILHYRYPQLLQLRVYEKGVYKQSRLDSSQIEDLRNKLEQIMNDDKPYIDEDFTLNKLANYLSISTQQLSELLNNKFGINFHTYINQYRVNEAMKMLVEEPDRSILSIAFAVGFNNKSSFYAAFSRVVKKNPSEFRKEMLSTE